MVASVTERDSEAGSQATQIVSDWIQTFQYLRDTTSFGALRPQQKQRLAPTASRREDVAGASSRASKVSEETAHSSGNHSSSKPLSPTKRIATLCASTGSTASSGVATTALCPPPPFADSETDEEAAVAYPAMIGADSLEVVRYTQLIGTLRRQQNLMGGEAQPPRTSGGNSYSSIHAETLVCIFFPTLTDMLITISTYVFALHRGIEEKRTDSRMSQGMTDSTLDEEQGSRQPSQVVTTTSTSGENNGLSGVHQQQSSVTPETGNPELVSPWLIVTTLVVFFGFCIPAGYHLTALNNPAAVIKNHLNTSARSQYYLSQNSILFERNILWSGVVSIYVIGATIGAICSSHLAEKTGSKGALVTDFILAALGTLCIAATKPAKKLELLFLGRLLLGLACGRVGWKPEDIAKEAEAIKTGITLAGSQPYYSLMDLIRKKEFHSALRNVLILNIGQQFTGTKAVFFYSTEIFQHAGIHRDESQFATIGVMLVNALSLGFSMPVTANMPRRLSLMGSLSGTSISMTVLALSLAFLGKVNFLTYTAIGATNISPSSEEIFACCGFLCGLAVFIPGWTHVSSCGVSNMKTHAIHGTFEKVTGSAALWDSTRNSQLGISVWMMFRDSKNPNSPYYNAAKRNLKLIDREMAICLVGISPMYHALVFTFIQFWNRKQCWDLKRTWVQTIRWTGLDPLGGKVFKNRCHVLGLYGKIFNAAITSIAFLFGFLSGFGLVNTTYRAGNALLCSYWYFLIEFPDTHVLAPLLRIFLGFNVGLTYLIYKQIIVEYMMNALMASKMLEMWTSNLARLLGHHLNDGEAKTSLMKKFPAVGKILGE
ncbi:unnamed protein product [Notodromas monacha]|uniref:Uncharacterized protein n=1 Tax=Notodromas monacha TaxID=399045 RepID=A0A7R9BNC1_9CRUS|nr:unnamed protein product [Notodromas monacha]CAG0918642.1 unnamed protein product [Notodromas monacha]